MEAQEQSFTDQSCYATQKRRSPMIKVTGISSPVTKANKLFLERSLRRGEPKPLHVPGMRSYHSLIPVSPRKSPVQFPKLRSPGGNFTLMTMSGPSAFENGSATTSSGLAKLYRGMFSPDVGRMVEKLSSRQSNAEGESEAFLTQRNGELEKTPNKAHVPSRRSSYKVAAAYDDLLATCFTKEEHKGRLSAAKVRAAIGKLADSIMNEGSHSLRSRFEKFVETGEKEHLFFCDLCPHCRMRGNDIYAVKHKMGTIPESERDHYFFDCININKSMASLDVC